MSTPQPQPPAAEAAPPIDETRENKSLPNVTCLRVEYSRCSPLSITEAVVNAVKNEAPAIKKAAVAVWRELLGQAGYGGEAKSLEELWVQAGLEPVSAITDDDVRRAREVVEKALEKCKLCVVDLQNFTKLLTRVALAVDPAGPGRLAVEVEYGGQRVLIVTKVNEWIRKTKDGVKYDLPLTLQERLRQIGIGLDLDSKAAYLELTARAERFNSIAEMHIRPMLLQIVEKMRADPSAYRCSAGGQILYVRADALLQYAMAFDAQIALGRNSLYRTLHRLGLTAGGSTVTVRFTDEFGNSVVRRAVPFIVKRLVEFLDIDELSICKAGVGEIKIAEEAGERQEAQDST